jgi:hypothetical protein
MKKIKLFSAIVLVCTIFTNCSKEKVSPKVSSLDSPNLKASFKNSLAASVNSTKRGVSYAYYNQDPINSLGPQTWYYNWQIRNQVLISSGSTFVPMVWKGADVTADNLKTAKTYGNTLLTFNEPDNSGQSNMTYTEALTYWPTLQATGMLLGSPAVSSGQDPSLASGWLWNFMQGAKANNYRVDFICLHYYMGEYNALDPVGIANKVIANIKAVYALYGKPIWITEFALTWGNNTTPAQEYSFMQTIIPQLESLTYVKKYCWWTSYWGTETVASSWCLTDGNGNINGLGNLYNTFGRSTGNGITSGNTYQLTSRANNLAVDNYGSTSDLTVVKQGTPFGGTNQQWVITSLDNGYYKLVNKTSGKALDNGGTSTVGASIIQLTDVASNNNNQQWGITNLGNGYYKLVNRTSGMALDNNSAKTNGVPEVQWTDNASSNNNQQWIIANQ